MKANYWKIIQMAVDQGIGSGLSRAFKHTDDPTRDLIHREVELEIMAVLHEYFVFDIKDD